MSLEKIGDKTIYIDLKTILDCMETEKNILKELTKVKIENIIIDFNSFDYIKSSDIGYLIKVKKDNMNKNVILINTNDMIINLLKLTKVYEYFIIKDDKNSAIDFVNN